MYHLLYYCPSFFLFHFLFLFLSHRSPYRFCFSCAKTFPIQLLEPILKKKSGLNFFSSKVVYRMCNSDRKKIQVSFYYLFSIYIISVLTKNVGTDPYKEYNNPKKRDIVYCVETLIAWIFPRLHKFNEFPRTCNPSLIFHMFRKYNPEHIIIIDS